MHVQSCCFLNKPIAFLTFSLASPSSLLKLPIKFLTMTEKIYSVLPVCCVPVTFTMLTSDFVPKIERHSIYNEA